VKENLLDFEQKIDNSIGLPKKTFKKLNKLSPILFQKKKFSLPQKR